jgi:acetyl-CoA synthetase
MTGPWLGYDMPTNVRNYQGLVERFDWDLPASYNVAQHALDGDRDRVALCHVPDQSTPTTVRTLTYGDLAVTSARFATRLAERGVDSGDRVVVSLPQCPELVVAHLAVLRLGGVVVPASIQLGTEAFEHVCSHSGASAAVVDREYWQTAQDVIREPASTVRVSVDDGPPPAGGLGQYVGDAQATPLLADTSPEDDAFVLYTSGTSGQPKGVVQRHASLLGSLPGYHCWFGLFDEETASQARVWTPSEWAWAGALFDVVYPTLALGGTVVSAVRREPFDPQRALAIVGVQDVSHAFVPPTALRAIRTATDPGEQTAPALETIMSGGEHLPESLSSWAETALDVTVNEAYGLTEANALVGEAKPRFEGVEDGLGRPYPGHDVVVLESDDQGESADRVGELAVRRPDPVVMRGYLDDAAATAAVLDSAHLRTGDIARQRTDGTLVHLGRADDLIITSGYRVSPVEVESVLERQAGVAAALVTGEADPDRGQIVVATVVPTDAVVPDEQFAERLVTRVADTLGPYKRPRRVEFTDALPTTRTDKTARTGAERE